MNRSRKAAFNSASQLLLYFVTAVCGFIVPKLVLESFGSVVNGTVTSIAQFIGFISLLESGFAIVTKTALYKPLAENDKQGISGVFNASDAFFKKIALIFVGYCLVLACVFPFIGKNNFNFLYNFSLVIIIGINTFGQYYFGISYNILFNADQKAYVGSILQTTTIVLNAIIIAVMVKLGKGIHTIKFVSALVFVIKPIIMNRYGKWKYKIDSTIPKNYAALSQRWDNLGQCIALYVHTKTAYVMMTLFLTMVEVSVYSVYALVTTSLSAIIAGLSSGFAPGLGNIYVLKEKENFKRVFGVYEFVNTFIAVGFYTIAAVLIIPFVKVYTQNVAEGNYIRPLFAMLLIFGEMVYCMRLPYNDMIANAGHFKQIKRGAYFEAGINIVISLCLVFKLGIVGLAIGNLVAMLYRTCDLVRYCSKNITKQSQKNFYKRTVLNIIGALLAAFICSLIKFNINNFFDWIIFAAITGVIVFVVLGILNMIFYRDDVKTFATKCMNILKKN